MEYIVMSLELIAKVAAMQLTQIEPKNIKDATTCTYTCGAFAHSMVSTDVSPTCQLAARFANSLYTY